MRPYIFTMPEMAPLPEGQSSVVTTFPDKEQMVEVPETPGHAKALLVGSCHDALSNEAMLAAAYELSRRFDSLTVVITYFRNARSERRTTPQAVVMAKFQAHLWSSLGHRVRIHIIEPHSDLIENYFAGPTVRQHSWLDTLVTRALCERAADVIATVDEGRASAARKMADARNKGFAFISKQRLSGTETRVRSVQGDVNDKTVLIVDDMIATGSSLVKAAQAYRERGAKAVFAVATHGVFAPGSECLDGGPLDRVWVSDTHPHAALEAENIGCVRVMPYLTEFLDRIA